MPVAAWDTQQVHWKPMPSSQPLCQPGNSPDGRSVLTPPPQDASSPAPPAPTHPPTDGPLDSGTGWPTSNIFLLFLQKLPSLRAGLYHSAKVFYHRVPVDSSVDPLSIKGDGTRNGLTPFKENKNMPLLHLNRRRDRGGALPALTEARLLYAL